MGEPATKEDLQRGMDKVFRRVTVSFAIMMTLMVVAVLVGTYVLQ